MSDVTALFMSAVTDYGPELLKQIGQGALQKVGGGIVAGLKKRYWDPAPAPEVQAIPAPAFSEELLEYLRRQDRVFETTLQCLNQLSSRVQKIATARTSSSTYVAIGIAPTRDQRVALASPDVQAVLNDVTPGVPQTIKSGFALAHLSRGNRYLAEIYAQSILKSNPVDPAAHFILAHVLLQAPIRDLLPTDADKAENHFATAAEAGLGPQSAFPRAALRIDHYKYRKRRPPPPQVAELSLVFETHRTEATAWPFRELNRQLIVSTDFKQIWGD